MTRLLDRAPWHIWTRPGFRLGFAIVPYHPDGDELRPREGWDVNLWLGPLIIAYRHRRPWDALSAVLRAARTLDGMNRPALRIVVSPDVMHRLREQAARRPGPAWWSGRPIDPERVAGVPVMTHPYLPPRTIARIVP